MNVINLIDLVTANSSSEKPTNAFRTFSALSWVSSVQVVELTRSRHAIIFPRAIVFLDAGSYRALAYVNLDSILYILRVVQVEIKICLSIYMHGKSAKDN